MDIFTIAGAYVKVAFKFVCKSKRIAKFLSLHRGLSYPCTTPIVRSICYALISKSVIHDHVVIRSTALKGVRIFVRIVTSNGV